MKLVDNNNGSLPIKPVYGPMYGTPTTAVTNQWIHITAGMVGQPSINTDIYFTILPASSGTAPIITNNPVGTTNVAGSSLSFSVTAGGTAPLKYQWRLASSGLAGATNATLALTNILLSQAGNYTVVITNASGAVTSSVAVLALTNPLPAKLSAPTRSNGLFQFTFVPAVGLTNEVDASYDASFGTVTLLTNVPPPASASPVTVTDVMGTSNRFYRVKAVTF